MPNNVLRAHAARYPQSRPEDAVKLLYQQHFGAGHALDALHEAYRSLLRECAAVLPEDEPLFEDIGGGMCRVSLAALNWRGLHPRALFRLFAVGAADAAGIAGDAGVAGGAEASPPFHNSLAVLQTMANDGELPFTGAACAAFLSTYTAAGCPALSHSAAYRAAYAPAYRVLPYALAVYLPLFSGIEHILKKKKGTIIIGVDGMCASGKTTLANLLQAVYDCACIHMDDFFLPPMLRTQERLQTPGGNIHYERFYEEVTLSLLRNEPPRYRQFDCGSMLFLPVWKQAPPARMLVVEGSYSLHPDCALPCDLRVFLKIPPQEQLARLRKRETAEGFARFVEQWIPMEESYFAAYRVADRCRYVIDTNSEI